MTSFPLLHILLWIAVMCAPPQTSQINIKAGAQNMTWTKQASGWVKSVDLSEWTIDGSNVTRSSNGEIDKEDVSEFVKGIKEQDWSKSTSLRLGPTNSLTSVGNTFVYKLNERDPTEEQFVITYKK